MANLVKHRFASAKSDGPDASQVQPSHWNDGHAFNGGATGDVLTRDTTDAAYGAKWVTPAPPVGWIAYVPKWYIGATEITALGNHAVSGLYHRRGDAVWFSVFFQVGTDPLPDGQWAFSLPVTSTALITPAVGLLHAGFSGANRPLFTDAFGGADKFRVWHLPASMVLAAFTAFSPLGLSNGWYVELRGNYQAGVGALGAEDRPAVDGGLVGA